ncbi:hypothetical protein J9303_13170 [Bacillaceae bacterium Marseille-Q3522]|nr:hypothetical protein [Bacillaceae bacterium Marseille-Q3522]
MKALIYGFEHGFRKRKQLKYNLFLFHMNEDPGCALLGTGLTIYILNENE